MSAGRFDAVVIGAGLAGLACGARLRARGVERFRVLELGEGVGASWRRHYQRLRMNTPFHDLPGDGGLRGQWGTFMSRAELVSYLEAYAALHGLASVMQFREHVGAVRRVADGWEIDATSGTYHARFVVVATATNRVPRQPEIPESSSFAGRRLHSAEYRNAEPFRAQRVLVLGSGNSAADIALDLFEGGARSVALWARGPRHVLSHEAFARSVLVARRRGVAFTSESLRAAHRYTRVHPEWGARLREQDLFLECFSIDLSQYGLRRPSEGPATEAQRTGREPWYDVGTVREIFRGNIELIDGNVHELQAFTREGLRFTGGERPFDAVVYGTGFVPGLEKFIADAERLLHWDGGRPALMPRTNGRCRSSVEPSLFFPGFDQTPYAGMSLGLWGAEVADAIAQELEAS